MSIMSHCASVLVSVGVFPKGDSNDSDRVSDIMRIICDNVCHKWSHVPQSGSDWQTDRQLMSSGTTNNELESRCLLSTSLRSSASALLLNHFSPPSISAPCPWKRWTCWKWLFSQPVTAFTICHQCKLWKLRAFLLFCAIKQSSRLTKLIQKKVHYSAGW